MKKICVLLSVVLCLTFCLSLGSIYAEENTAAETTETTIEESTDTEIAEEILEAAAAVASDGTVTISWESVSMDAVYTVMRSASADGVYESVAVITGVEGTSSYNDTALNPAEIRYYKVSRIEGEITVKESEAVSVKMPLTPPAAVKTSLADGKYVKITWNKVAGATEYKVYRSLAKNGTYKLLKTVTGTSYTDKTVYSGEAFYYKVRACKTGSDSVKSTLSSYAAYYTKPSVPKITTANNNGAVKVSWKKVSRAQLYYVYRLNKEKKYVKIGETKKLSYTDKKGTKNAFLYYKVRAVYKQDGKTVKSDLSKSSKVLSRYVNPDKKMVAFTFDDGPSKYTKAIVKCLFENDSAATFFVVGNRINSYKDTVAYTYSRGCELGNHSYSHPLLTGMTKEQVKKQIRKTDNRVKAITGQKTSLVRVPYGGYNKMVKNAVGKPLIQWSDDTLDWKTRSKSATVKYVMNNVQDGDIILMHDIHEPTKNAALELIPKLKKKGYQIVTVSELAKYKGYKMKNGTAYFSFR